MYDLLCDKFNKDDIKRQYKSVLYPFKCDFYITTLNLYIECNFSWTHGGHFYDKTNNKDIEILQTWINKQSKYYDNAIYTWTERDINKLKIAMENNLNYLVFWNIDEVKEWLNEN